MNIIASISGVENGFRCINFVEFFWALLHDQWDIQSMLPMFCFMLICDNNICNFDCGSRAHMRICKILWQLADKQKNTQRAEEEEKFNINDILLQPSLLLEPDESYYLESSIAILYYFIKDMPSQ